MNYSEILNSSFFYFPTVLDGFLDLQCNCKLMRKYTHRRKGVFNMSLTRKMLKAMAIEDEKIDQIIDAHTETTESLKEERDNYKESAEKVTD